MSAALDNRRRRAWAALGPNASRQDVDALVRLRMAGRTLGTKDSLALQAAEEGKLYVDEKLRVADLVELDLIEQSGDVWILTSNGRQFMEAWRILARGLEPLVRDAALRAHGVTDEQIARLK